MNLCHLFHIPYRLGSSGSHGGGLLDRSSVKDLPITCEAKSVDSCWPPAAVPLGSIAAFEPRPCSSGVAPRQGQSMAAGKEILLGPGCFCSTWALFVPFLSDVLVRLITPLHPVGVFLPSFLSLESRGPKSFSTESCRVPMYHSHHSATHVLYSGVCLPEDLNGYHSAMVKAINFVSSVSKAYVLYHRGCLGKESMRNEQE